MIEKFDNCQRGEWLALRRQDITGSQVGALFGVHRYMTPAALYAEKIGATPEDDEESEVMTRGIRLESFVAEQIMIRHPNLSIKKASTYYRDKEHRLGGTPDYYVQDMDTGKSGVLEIKTVGASDFKRLWRGGDDEGEIIPEPWQMLQCLQYQYLTGAAFGMIGVLPVSEWSPMDVHVVPIPQKPAVIERIKFEADRFWRMIDQGLPPDFDFAKDMDVVKALYASAEEGKCADLRWDPEFPKLLDVREKLKDVAKGYDKEIEDIEARIRAKIGDAETALADGWSVSLKNTHRKSYTVGETNYRVLRAKRSKVLVGAE